MEIVELRVQVEDSQLKKLVAEVEALKKTTINLGVNAGKGGSGGGSSGDPTAGVRKGLKETQTQAEKTGQSMLSVVGKVAKWTAVTTAVYAPIHAFKEAINTLKEVDSQLVQVQKVTDFSAKQMKDIEQQAYKTASAYGVSADKYLESVSAFARAGYKEQSEQLAELSVKTQLVGDTTAEVANQFLLSTDAAYQYQGNIEQLTRILDGANELDNKYATSIEKIAEGMGLVAPVAAQAHVGVDELMASIGTITAVTQRSGSETARALRALFLNIMGDTKTEIDEGVTWTTGEIAGLQDVLRKFAPDVVKAAEATKSVINPMEAMNALAKAMKEGALTEQDLMEMVSDIGGKLRSSQLLALIQNWDMYESMLSDFQNAAGSADREIDNAMNSWERKTEVLKNTWTEFVSHLVDTDMIKGGLDAVTGFVEFLDSGMGEAAIKAGTVALALTGVSKAIAGIGKAIGGSKSLELLTKFFSVAQADGLLAALSKAATFIGPLGVAIAAIAAVAATPAIVDLFTTDFAEQGEKVSQLKSEYEQLYGVESEYQNLVDKWKSGEGLTAWEQSRLDYLERYQTELKNTIEEERKIAASKYQEEYGSMAQSSLDEDYYRNGGRGKRDNETIDVKNLREARKAFDELNEATRSGQKGQLEYQQGIDEILASYEDFYTATKQGLDEGWLKTDDLTQAQKDLMDLYETMQKLRDVPLDKLDVAVAIEDFKAMSEVGDKSVVNWKKLKKAMEEAGASAEDIEATLASMQQDENIVLIDVEADGAEETLKKIESIGIAVKDADGWKINIEGLTNLMSELGYSRDEIVNLVSKLQEINGVSFVDAEGNIADLKSEMLNSGSAIANTIANVKEKAEELNGVRPRIVMSAKDNATKVADNVKKAVRTIPRAVAINITANAGPVLAAVRTANAALATFRAAKSILSGVGGNAEGTDNWRGGPTLLGDEASPSGAPRPELVITRNGKAFVAGLAGPTVANLPAGSRVFPYSDTVGILSGQDMTQIHAFSAGNDRILNHYLNPTTAGSGSSTSSSSSSGSSSGGSNSGSKSGSSSGSKSGSSGGKTRTSSSSATSGSSGEDSYLKQLQDELEVLRAQYSFLEASGAATDDLVGKSREIQGKLHEINDRLRATGGSQKDIYSYSTDWYNELENIHKVVTELYEKERSILESRAELMRENSSDDRTRIANLKKILENLHDQAEYMRSYGASEEEVLELSIQWWNVHKDILEVYEDEKNLLESQVDLMEKQSAPAADRIGKLRLIQQNLHQQAEYMRKIGARQEEINQKSIEWWEIQNRILQIQQDLMDELDAAINHQLTQARKARDDELKIIDEQIKKLQEERDIQEEQLSIEERRKQVEEARLALENAKNQRTVRYYNAATGQWEWGADANNVKSAQEAYDRAKKDYEQDQKDRAYDAQIKALELKRDEINNRYDLLESRWDALADSFAEPLRDIKDILGDLLATGKLTDEQVALIKSLVGDIGDYTLSILSALLTFQQYQDVMGGATAQEYVQYLKDWLDENGWTAENKDAAWDIINQSGSGEVAARFAAEYINQAANLAREQAGVSSSGDSSSAPAAVQNAAAAAAAAAASAAASAAMGETSSSGPKSSVSYGGKSSSASASTIKSSSTTKSTKSTKKYDSGGILSGLGGIKATAEDEIVVPPDVAKFMLRPSANQQFKARMAELGYLYGATSRVPNLTGMGSNQSSNDHYGDVYQYGNITLSEEQARGMTVYDLAQKARSLGIYNAV